MDLKDLIAKQRVEIERPVTETVDVVLGGELVTVVFSRLLPDDWQQLVAEHPPRTLGGDRPRQVLSDGHVGYDQKALPRDYPVTHIAVAGEAVDVETWHALYDVLNTVHRENVHTVIWGLNVFDAIRELKSLGKAAAGSQSSSPAN